MPKKKKTREQKHLADIRRKSIQPSTIQPQINIAQPTKVTVSINKPEPINTSAVISTSGYNYLTSDLKKTLMLTTAIIIAEYIFYYFIF